MLTTYRTARTLQWRMGPLLSGARPASSTDAAGQPWCLETACQREQSAVPCV